MTRATILAMVLVMNAGAHASEPEDLVIIVAASNPVKSVSAPELEAMFTRARRQWPDGSMIIVFNYEPNNETRWAFDRAVLRMSPDAVGRFWRDMRIRTGERPPRHVADPRIATRLVARLKGAIAYVPEAFVDPTVKVVARIRNSKVVTP